MLRGDRLSTVYVLAATSGPRWSDVDPDEGTITICQSAVVFYYRVEIAKPKTARSRRSISLDSKTLSIPRQHRQAMLGERLYGIQGDS